jgi:hypothetical protein
MFGISQSRTEVWTTVQAGVDAATVVSAKGRTMNPMRGVQLAEVGFRVGPGVRDRANRCASEEESRRCLDPMRSTHGRVMKANESLCTRCQRRHAIRLGLGCEIALELRLSNLERSWVSVRGSTPGA